MLFDIARPSHPAASWHVVSIETVTEIFCPPGLREHWQQEGSSLPAFWHRHYPLLFDDEDLRIADGPQRRGHFSEWFAAIHLFHRDGSISFIEKYDTYENHRNNRLHRNVHARKRAEYERVVSEEQRQILHEIGSEFRIQLPDLLVVSRDAITFSFCEVKGPTDGTLNRPDQRGSRDAIRQRLGVPVEIIKVSLLPGRTANTAAAERGSRVI